jgi:hypothetical protein
VGFLQGACAGNRVVELWALRRPGPALWGEKIYCCHFFAGIGSVCPPPFELASWVLFCSGGGGGYQQQGYGGSGGSYGGGGYSQQGYGGGGQVGLFSYGPSMSEAAAAATATAASPIRATGGIGMRLKGLLR